MRGTGNVASSKLVWAAHVEQHEIGSADPEGVTDIPAIGFELKDRFKARKCNAGRCGSDFSDD